MYEIPAISTDATSAESVLSLVLESLTELVPRFLPDPTTMLGVRDLSSDKEAHEGEVVPLASAAVSSDQVAARPKLNQ